MEPAELIRIRREEQREAARRAGAKDVYFLDHIDGELEPTREFLGDVVRHIRMLKPYAVFTHDPEAFIVRNSFINHSDHRFTGQVTIDAIYPSARDRLNFPEHIAEGLETHNVKEIFIWGSEKANFDVDISDVVDQKIHALNAHVSQGLGAEDPHSEFLKFVRERWRGEDGRYTERFRRVVLFR
jgi:LmbE family N-acetylglucosaminyl deacetylase